MGFLPHERWFSCQRMRLLVDKKTKKKSSSIHETSPPDHYSKGASDCSVNDSRISVGSDKPKRKTTRICVVINTTYDIERPNVYFVNDIFIISVSEITLEDYNIKRPSKQRKKN